MKKYLFRGYDPRYPRLYLSEERRLVQLLAPGARIEHVGSTAVPGLGGKGVIDVIVGVRKNQIASAKCALRRAGYEFKPLGGDTERLFFQKDYGRGRGRRRFHVHLTSFRGRTFRQHVAFRDYLRTHPAACQEYARVKRRAVRLCRGEGERYRALKNAFVSRTSKRALKCNYECKKK